MNCARLILLLSLAPLFAACKSEPIALGLRLEPGHQLDVALAMSQVVTEEREGAEFESDQNVLLQWRQTIEDVRPDGSAVLSLAYQRARLSASNPSFGTISYDSKNPPATIPMLAIGLHAAVGETVRLRLNERGEILSVPGIESFADRIFNKLELPPTVNSNVARSALRQWFSEDAMREMMRPIFSIYPDGLVQTGDSWQREAAIQQPFPHRQINEYKLVDVDEKTATIRVRSELEPEEDAIVRYDRGSSARFDVEGGVEGKLVIDRATGFVVLGELTQELEGTVTFTDQNGESVESSLSLEGRVEYAADQGE